MPYVQRDAGGAITGLFANAQEGYAEEWLRGDDAGVSAFQEHLASQLAGVIYKADIWRRATEAEAEAIDAQLNAQPIRLRRMWQDSQAIFTTDEMYAAIHTAFVAAFGEARAAELLQPSQQ